jgi:DNA-binding XRE family transcriptional regulator
MPKNLDLPSLRQERLRRRWSQEQLAEISGVSVRTLQRFERGEAIGPASQSAIAAAFRPLTSISKATRGTGDVPRVRRVTPLCVLPDIDDAVAAYVNLGFAKIETDHQGCVGVRAGLSHMILASAQFLAGDYGERAVEPLIGQTIPYIWVQSVTDAVNDLPSSASVIVVASTQAGTREALVELAGRYQIFADFSGSHSGKSA